MALMSESNYLNWQKQLNENKLFRYFWQFWSNYAFLFFAAAALAIYFEPEFASVRNQVYILLAISFAIARGGIVSLINLLYKRQRPYQKMNFTPITSNFFSWKTKIHNSFPSRHTTAYFSVATVILMYIPVFGIVLIAASILAGMARVVLGYHWPSDILAGAALGSVVGVLVVYLGGAAFFT